MEDWTNYEVRQKFYHSKEWLNLREYVLANEPLCRKCKVEGYLVPATEVDHIIDIEEEPDLRLNIDNVQPLCKSCHSRKTMKKTMKGNIPPNKKNQNKLWKRKWNMGSSEKTI